MKYLYTILFFILFQTVSSQTIKIDTNFSKIAPVSQLFYLVDLENNFNKTNIIYQTFETTTKQHFGIKKGNYWFKLKIKNTSSNTKKLVFDIREAIVSQVKIYKLKKDTLSLIYKLDAQDALAQEHKIFQNVTIPLNVAPENVTQLYLKVTFPKTAYFPLTIRSVQNETKTLRFRLLRMGLYYGFALMVFIINFFFYVSLKDKVFIYYLVFSMAIACGLLYYDGFFYEILKQGRFLYHIDSYIHFFTGLTGALFATKFLQLPIYFKRINKIGIVLLIVMAILYILQTNTDYYLFTAMADLIGFVLLTIYWVTGILIIKKHDYARFFVLGYSLILISGALYVIPLDFGFQGVGITLNHLKLGGMVEMLILTYAITYRTKILQNEYNFISLELHEFIDKYMHLELTVKSSKKADAAIDANLENLKKNHALSDREAEVLLCIAQHKTNKEIAEYLYLSVNTIKFHTRNLYEKLDINTRAAVRHKLEETL